MSTSSPPLPTLELTPALCFHPTYLRDFLRLSRAQLDDTISTNLNALQQPSLTSPFDPTSTTNPSTNRPNSLSRRTPIPQSTCASFIDQTLFPSWSQRSKLLSYCSVVATSPDPDDPDARQIEMESVAASHRKIDERLDPYSGRFFPREKRVEMLAGTLRNENAVEGIVRERTWRVLGERCLGSPGTSEGWNEAFHKWAEKSGKS